jgi:hypothetical protein
LPPATRSLGDGPEAKGYSDNLRASVHALLGHIEHWFSGHGARSVCNRGRVWWNLNPRIVIEFTSQCEWGLMGLDLNNDNNFRPFNAFTTWFDAYLHEWPCAHDEALNPSWTPPRARGQKMTRGLDNRTSGVLVIQFSRWIANRDRAIPPYSTSTLHITRREVYYMVTIIYSCSKPCSNASTQYAKYTTPASVYRPGYPRSTRNRRRRNALAPPSRVANLPSKHTKKTLFS